MPLAAPFVSTTATPGHCPGRRTRAVAVVAVALLALTACSNARRHGDDPAGRVWSSADNAFVEERIPFTRVRAADLVLLGETHTIAAHHRQQARLIRRAAADRRPAVVFEMIRRDQQGAIARWRADGADPVAFGAAVEWEARGWPDWSLYRPIVEAALERELPLLGGTPPEATLRRVAHDGLGALGPERRRALGLDRPLPQAGHRRLAATLRAAHCGVDADTVAAMLAVQRLRDAWLAETLRDAAREHGAAVLIAGRGHTRADHGVPAYLDATAAGIRVVAVAFAGTGEFPGVAALRRAQGGVLGHDFVWFTAGGEPAPACGETNGG